MHDWFQGFHGAERTVAAMFDVFERDPDVFTFHAEPELLPPRVAASDRQASRASAALPGVRQRGHDPGRWRWLLPYMPHYFEHLDLDGYELVISSSHACAAGSRPARRDAARLLLPHADALRLDARGGAQQGRRIKGLALAALRGRLRDWDRRASARPDLYLANSTAVMDRIKRFYGRDSVLVPPPVAVADFPLDVPRDPAHFLWVHRLVPYKRPLEVAEAFRELPELRLTMVGVGPLEAVGIAQAREIAPGAQKGVLRGVMGKLGVAEHEPRDTQELPADPVTSAPKASWSPCLARSTSSR